MPQARVAIPPSPVQFKIGDLQVELIVEIELPGYADRRAEK